MNVQVNNYDLSKARRRRISFCCCCMLSWHWLTDSLVRALLLRYRLQSISTDWTPTASSYSSSTRPGSCCSRRAPAECATLVVQVAGLVATSDHCVVDTVTAGQRSWPARRSEWVEHLTAWRHGAVRQRIMSARVTSKYQRYSENCKQRTQKLQNIWQRENFVRSRPFDCVNHARVANGRLTVIKMYVLETAVCLSVNK